MGEWDKHLEELVYEAPLQTLVLRNEDTDTTYEVQQSGHLGRKAFIALRQDGQAPPVEVFLKAANNNETKQVVREASIFDHLNAVSPEHPFIRPIDYFTDRDYGMQCLVFPFVPSTSLDQCLERQGPMPPPLVALMVTAIAEQLAAAHNAGVLHKDIKPDNILIPHEGELPSYRKLSRIRTAFQLTDFGIAYGPGLGKTTREGFVSGTPMYTAPEIFFSEDHSVQAETYSLAMTGLHCLFGKQPYSETTQADLGNNKASFGFPSGLGAIRADYPTIADVIEKGIEPLKGLRYASPRTFAEAFNAVINPDQRKKEKQTPEGSLLTIPLRIYQHFFK